MTEKPKVYFTKVITPEKLIEMYNKLDIKLQGNIAVKVHSGEKGNQNFIRPEFMKPIVDLLDATIVETNTSCPEKFGERTTYEKHKKLLEEHGWTKVFKKVEILDSEQPDEELDIPNGILLKKNYIGNKTKNFDGFLVLSHFKGHGMGGFGGALKQLSIGFGSRFGKTLMHSAGKNGDPEKFFENICTDKEFKEAMADCAYSVVNKFKGKMVFINVMKNISIDCDCDGNAKPPCMKDIGILASTDPVAIDKACLDLIYNSDDPGKKEVIERIVKLLGPHIIECSVQLGTGSSDYELINVD
jgi:uncharacterized Fe-S center protein